MKTGTSLKIIFIAFMLAIPLFSLNREEIITGEDRRNHIYERRVIYTSSGERYVTTRARLSACGPDIEISDSEINPNVAYTSTEFPWLNVTSGINYGGYCRNSGCPAQGGYVYIPIGGIDYLIRNGEYCYPSRCPACGGEVEVRDWGFSRCCFQIRAQKTNGHRESRPWRRADEYYYKLSMDDLGSAEYEEVRISYVGAQDPFPAPEPL